MREIMLLQTRKNRPKTCASDSVGQFKRNGSGLVTVRAGYVGLQSKVHF